MRQNFVLPVFDKADEDVYCVGGITLWSGGASMTECKTQCASDRRCAAFAYFIKRKQCSIYALCPDTAKESRVHLYTRLTTCDLAVSESDGFMSMIERGLPAVPSAEISNLNVQCWCIHATWMICGLVPAPGSLTERILTEKFQTRDPEALAPFELMPSDTKHFAPPVVYRAMMSQTQQVMYGEMVLTSHERCINLRICAATPGYMCPVLFTQLMSREAVYILKQDEENVRAGKPVACISAPGLREFAMADENANGFEEPLGRVPGLLFVQRDYDLYFLFSDEDIEAIRPPKKKSKSRGKKKKKSESEESSESPPLRSPDSLTQTLPDPSTQAQSVDFLVPSSEAGPSDSSRSLFPVGRLSDMISLPAEPLTQVYKHTQIVKKIPQQVDSVASLALPKLVISGPGAPQATATSETQTDDQSTKISNEYFTPGEWVEIGPRGKQKKPVRSPSPEISARDPSPSQIQPDTSPKEEAQPKSSEEEEILPPQATAFRLNPNAPEFVPRYHTVSYRQPPALLWPALMVPGETLFTSSYSSALAPKLAEPGSSDRLPLRKGSGSSPEKSEPEPSLPDIRKETEENIEASIFSPISPKLYTFRIFTFLFLIFTFCFIKNIRLKDFDKQDDLYVEFNA